MANCLCEMHLLGIMVAVFIVLNWVLNIQKKNIFIDEYNYDESLQACFIVSMSHYWHLIIFDYRIFQELERNAQSKCSNDEIVENKTGEQTRSCEDANKLPISRSFSGEYNRVSGEKWYAN